MRVISGKARGTQLVSLSGAPIRPTLDRVRESFFNQIADQVEGAWFLDLFAGTGAVGVEALSRGAGKVVFVECHHPAQTVIYNNLKKCGFFKPEEPDSAKNWILLKSNARHALEVLQKKHAQFDWVYVDPPFADDLYQETLLRLSASQLLQESATVVVEHFRKTGLLETYGKLTQTKTRRLGDTSLSFYELRQEAAGENLEQ